MSDNNLTQSEADALCKMEKWCVDNTEYELPDLGGKISVPLISCDKKEHFLLDLSRGRINLKKQTFQNRARETIVLVRLDFGTPHRNPPALGGNEVGIPHMHIYKEGFGDKFACDLPVGVFKNLNDSWQVLVDFMQYCNITKTPNFRKGLFS